MVYLGRDVRSCMDYIMETYHHLFRKLSVPDPRHNLDNYFILGCLHSTILRKHAKYLERHTYLLLWTLTTPTREYRLFAELHQEILNTKAQ